MREVRPLRSTGITPLPRYYEPVRLPAAADRGYGFPRGVARPPAAPRRVSQDPHRSVDARPPHSPRTARCVRLLVASASVAGFSTFGRLATAIGFTRSNRVRYRWARVFALVACERLARRLAPPDRSVSRLWLPSDAGPELHGERAIHMADTSQSARTPGLPWRNRRTEDERGRTKAVTLHCLRAGHGPPWAGAGSSRGPRNHKHSCTRPVLAIPVTSTRPRRASRGASSLECC